jgi:hypothetical protein
MFRCTSCASMKKFILFNDGYDLHYVDNEHCFYLVDESTQKKITSSSDLLYFMNKISECSSCKNHDTLQALNDAYNNPMDTFDKENICICGTELWLDRIPNSNSWAMVCDDCGWYDKSKIYSGSK